MESKDRFTGQAASVSLLASLNNGVSVDSELARVLIVNRAATSLTHSGFVSSKKCRKLMANFLLKAQVKTKYTSKHLCDLPY